MKEYENGAACIQATPFFLHGFESDRAVNTLAMKPGMIRAANSPLR